MTLLVMGEVPRLMLGGGGLEGLSMAGQCSANSEYSGAHQQQQCSIGADIECWSDYPEYLI